MAVMHSVGSFVGKAGAYAWEGSQLAATEFARGAKEGYAEKAAELQLARQRALTGQAPVKLARAKAITAKA